MKTYNTIIIGAGASGLLSAIALNDNNSILLEKNEIMGKKLLLTGGGRCNLTNNSDFNEYMNNYYNTGKFYRNAFSTFFNKDIIKLLENNGCKTKIEEDNRVFPVSDDAKSVQQTLINILENSETQYKLNSKVTSIIKKEDKFIVTYNKKQIQSKYLILSTGGNSYPKTGSSGDGYEFAKKLGHNISPQMGGLSPIKIREKWIKKLQGITIKAFIEFKSENKSLFKGNGSIIFTHNGLSGFIILDNSMLLEKHLREEKNVTINMDLCKEYSYEQLDTKLIDDFKINANKKIKTYIHNYLPKKMSYELLKKIKVDPEKILNQISKKERLIIRDNLKKITLNVDKVLEKESMVTNSGVIRKEIKPNNFESKKMENLYIVGELIEGCGICGGYNLQQAFSTGFVAGKDIKERLTYDTS